MNNKPTLGDLMRIPIVSGGKYGDVKIREPLRRVYLNAETKQITIEKYDMKKQVWEITDQYSG